MISRPVEVDISYDYVDKIWLFNLTELPEDKRDNSWKASDYITFKFCNFKNNFELCKKEKDKLKEPCSIEMGSSYKHVIIPEKVRERICHAASLELRRILKIEADRAMDMKRALELKSIIEKADFDHGKLVVIKVKTSSSKRYSGFEGYLHTPSDYLTLVPEDVEEEARALQAIRRKHQEDREFDFIATDYPKVILRCADHGFVDIDISTDYNQEEDIIKNGIDASKI